MKKSNLVLLAAIITMIFTACHNRDEHGSTDTSNTDASHSVTDSTRGDKSAETTPTPISTVQASQESIEFANKAATGGMMEVELGKLAQQNAKSQRVKDFGSMMVTDHSQANEELKRLASENNITLPASLPADQQQHIDLMSKMKADAFDNHYMDMMVNDHKGDIGEFKKEAAGSNHDAFNTFAAKTLPTLQKHLDSAMAISGKKNPVVY